MGTCNCQVPTSSGRLVVYVPDVQHTCLTCKVTSSLAGALTHISIHLFIHSFFYLPVFIYTDQVECNVPTYTSEPSYLTLPFRCIEYRVAVAAVIAPFAPFDTMYTDSQYSGTKETSRVCVDFPRLTSRHLASPHICSCSCSCNRRCIVIAQSRAEQNRVCDDCMHVFITCLLAFFLSFLIYMQV